MFHHLFILCFTLNSFLFSMNVDLEILKYYGATYCKVNKGEVLFNEDDLPRFYFQIHKGSVRIVSTSSSGREHFHRLCSKGQSFGLSSLFTDLAYIVSAIASEDAYLFKLPNEGFKKMIAENNGIALKAMTCLSMNIHDKFKTIQLLTCASPEERLMKFFNIQKKGSDLKSIVPFTRQQIANYTGLRVETVIRTLSRLKQEDKIKIFNRKIYY
jgi:CRP-like cAMP-binding protein